MLAVILIYTLIVGTYLALCTVVIRTAMKKAKEKEIPEWKYGVPFALIMFLPVFWEDVPTVAVYTYNCEFDAGFVIYKSVDEWIQENPGIAEAQIYGGGKSTRLGNVKGYISTRHTSDRFDYASSSERIFLTVRRIKRMWVDRNDSTILAEVINFRSGNPFDNGTLTGLKRWLYNTSCSQMTQKEYLMFEEYKQGFRKLGGQKN